MKYIILIYFSFFSIISFAQKREFTDLPIIIEYGILNNIELRKDTLVQFNDSISAKIYLYEKMGKMNITLYKNNNIFAEGSYINSLDTLAQYCFVVDGETGAQCYSLSKYFEPIENGIWRYYDNFGKLEKEFVHEPCFVK